jgi:transposase
MRTPTQYPKRSRTEWQQVRQAAVARFVAGERPRQIAPALGVSYEAVRLWYHRWGQSDATLLSGKPRGRPARLSSAQLEQLTRELLRGPTAHGYATELWTCKRIAAVIKKQFGVSYHESHVFKILRALGWTCQKPERRAKERNEARIQQWLAEDWPRIKKGP